MHKPKQSIALLMVFVGLVVILSTIPNTAIATTFIQVSPTPFQGASPTPTLTRTSAQATFVARENCLHTFEEFTLLGAPYRISFRTFPPVGWQIESTVREYDDRWGNPVFDVQQSRTIDGQQEIWIRGRIEDDLVWLIFRPEERSWERISRDIAETEFYTGELFVTSDGAMWASVHWRGSFSERFSSLETAPLLSRFNEATRQFEIPEGIPSLPPLPFEEISRRGLSYYWPVLLLDDRDVFWIFAQADGVFRYDPETSAFEELVDLPDLVAGRVALAPDGSIYFSGPSRSETAVGEFVISPDSVSQFNPDTDEITPLDFPDETWPYWGNLLFDRSGRLWLGASGYRDNDGSWHLTFPDPAWAFDPARYFSYTVPDLLFESSDGKLWYHRYAIEGIGTGVAWYDPETGEGCQITDYPSTIIEDSQQQLWMLVGGTLLRQSIS